MAFAWSALSLDSPVGVARVAAPDWLSGQNARYAHGDIQAQSCGSWLFARHPASSLGHVSTYIPSFFLGSRANSHDAGHAKAIVRL